MADYLPGGKLDPAQCLESQHILSNTPCASSFEESYFGVKTLHALDGCHCGPLEGACNSYIT